MTRDEIIKLAREAGVAVEEQWLAVGLADDFYMEWAIEVVLRVAPAITAPLQERIAALYEQIERTEKMLDDQYKMGMEAERKAILAFAASPQFNRMHGEFSPSARDLAAAIRARGEA